METKMNKNKTMLALLVIAALALCSVAVVASESDDSSAATTVPVTSSITVDSDVNGSNLNVYASNNDIVLTFTSDANYSGTIQFGMYDVATGKYTVCTTMVLDGVSDCTMTFAGIGSAPLNSTVKVASVPGTQSTGSTSGTFTVTKGAIQLGNDTTYFSGTVAGNTATLTSANTKGAVLTAGTTDILTGTVTAGEQKKVSSTGTYVAVSAKLTIDGTANVGTTLTFSGTTAVTFVVSEDSTLNVPANAQTYSVLASDTFIVQASTGNNIVYGIITDEYGQIVAATNDASASELVTFTVQTGMYFKVGTTYNMILVGETGVYYIGTIGTTITYDGTNYTVSDALTMSATTTSVSVNTESTEATTTNILAGKSQTVGSTSYTSTLKYDSDDYALIVASYIMSSDSTARIGADTTVSGSITFDNSTATAMAGKLFVLLQNKDTGAYYAYFSASVTSDTLPATSTTTALPIVTPTTISGSNYIVSGRSIDAKDVSDSSNPYTWKATGKGLDDCNTNITIGSADTLSVKGTVIVSYTSSALKGTITNSGTINIDGRISYTTTYTSTVSGFPIATGVAINSAGYYVQNGTTSTTYNYTTLNNAMTNASYIYIYGTIKLLEDTTLTGTSTTSNVFYVNGTIVIGQAYVAATAVASEIPAITVTVTVPSTTTLGTTSNINVVNGQLRIENLTVDGYSNVTAAVFLINDSYGIYTDLATALDIAESGDVKVRVGTSAITFSNNVELKSGVTLNMNSVSLTVASGTIFTVNGVLKASSITVEGATAATTTSVAKVAGSLVLNNYDNAMILTAVTLKGSLIFGSTFDNTATTASALATAITADGSTTIPATISVAGKVILGHVLNGNYVTVTVSGALTSNVASVFSSTSSNKLIVDNGTYTAKDNDSIDTIVVTGNGTIASATDKYITVTKITIGTPVTTMTANTNNATVVVKLNSTGTATVYGSFDVENISILAASNTNFSTAYYLTDSIVYATFYENNSGASKNIVSAIGDPEIVGKLFDVWCTSSSLNKEVGTSAVIGSYAKVYADFNTQTISVTLEYTQNGTWIVNGTPYTGGIVNIDWSSSYAISFIANNGYELNNYAVYVNGSTMPVGYEPSTGDVISFNGTVTEKVTPEDKSMDITTILLIIITIVVIIMAIIIAMKLMRS